MRTVLSLICALMLITTSNAQKTLNLDKAITIALHKNTILQKSINNLDVTESSVRAAVGNFLPILSAGAGWSWNRSEEAGGTINVGGSVIPVPPSTTESRNFSGNVTARLTLFDGLSNFAALSQSKNNVESARLDLQRLKQDIVFQTITLYYTVINAKQLLGVREDDLKWNQRNLETVTESNKLGAVTLADVYSQQVKTGNSELALIKAQNSFETAKSNLLNYLALDVLEDYKFSSDLTAEEQNTLNEKMQIDYRNISDLVNKALSVRTDFQSAQLKLESAYNGITIARSGHLPTLSNSFSYNIRANEFDKFFDSRTYVVGLSLNIPIFSGFRVSNNVQFAEVTAENKQIELSDLERSIKLEIQKTYLNLKAADKSLQVNTKNVIAAEETRKIEQERYSLGSGTLLNVLIANSDYTTARTNLITAQFEFIRLSKQLEYYLGVLNFNKYENE
ncbi:MAG: hypothetical protein COW08_05290 [Ignavibacteriales bacterium CG12_big_fil_rev_8_21_14_0_65_30_8]|nr:MAG: hypothetical protein COW08_05290 [Ignavibacteriales bacterium CG12_big_fil_rev_8_21_14_0_65_30_8]